MWYLVEKYGLSIDMVRYRIKIAKQKLKEYINLARKRIKKYVQNADFFFWRKKHGKNLPDFAKSSVDI